MKETTCFNSGLFQALCSDFMNGTIENKTATCTTDSSTVSAEGKAARIVLKTHLRPSALRNRFIKSLSSGRTFKSLESFA